MAVYRQPRRYSRGVRRVLSRGEWRIAGSRLLLDGLHGPRALRQKAMAAEHDRLEPSARRSGSRSGGGRKPAHRRCVRRGNRGCFPGSQSSPGCGPFHGRPARSEGRAGRPAYDESVPRHAAHYIGFSAGVFFRVLPASSAFAQPMACGGRRHDPAHACQWYPTR